MTDTERLDFLDQMMESGNNHKHFCLEGHHLFTIQTQHQTVENARQAIDLMEEFESERRCWECEHRHQQKGKCPQHRKPRK
ncbi:MAG TPA: hypothetical protein ENI27_00950 [bacterium]|nr:hypothetical protein [bacterium]